MAAPPMKLAWVPVAETMGSGTTSVLKQGYALCLRRFAQIRI